MSRCSRIGLGTVQWGMEYGVANNQCPTPIDEVGRILISAQNFGVQIIDSAALYGEAEDVLGNHCLNEFKVVTKTPRFAHTPITAEDAQVLNRTFLRSLERLCIPSAYGLLVHHADDLFNTGGEWLIEALLSLRAEGKVSRVGVSVYDGVQIESVLKRFTPDLVQLPLSVFDQRLINDGSLKLLSSLGVEIHVRSAFLQGLLLMNPNLIPSYFQPWKQQLTDWHKICAAHRVLPQHAALAFVCDRPEINCCLIGVMNSNQLNQSLEGLNTVETFDTSQFACYDLALVNPVNWRLS